MEWVRRKLGQLVDAWYTWRHPPVEVETVNDGVNDGVHITCRCGGVSVIGLYDRKSTCPRAIRLFKRLDRSLARSRET